jgi:hypothetical protein
MIRKNLENAREWRMENVSRKIGVGVEGSSMNGDWRMEKVS